MRRVSFEVAKAIKEAGYPQGITQGQYAKASYYDNELESYINEGEYIENFFILGIDAPTYLEVWLWLWREKGIKIDTTTRFDSIKGWLVIALISTGRWTHHVECSDPEEAIISAIEYLVSNNLIK